MLKGVLKNPKAPVSQKVGEKEKNVKKKEEEEGQELTDLVSIDYTKKDEPAVKVARKKQENKLEEKVIDVSTIPVEKKEEKKPITSWIVEEVDVKKLMTKEFKLEEHETDFQSLTNNTLNVELNQKKIEKAAEAAEIKIAAEVAQGPKNAASGNFASKDQELTLSKKKEGFQMGIPVASGPVRNFVNSKATNNEAPLEKAPLEKTPQQLKEEEIEAKLNLKIESKPIVAKEWVGVKLNNPVPEVEFKQSAWAMKIDNDMSGGQMKKFAPMQKTAQELKQEQKFEQASKRTEQEFKFTTKKEVEERRVLREERQKQDKEKLSKGQ